MTDGLMFPKPEKRAKRKRIGSALQAVYDLVHATPCLSCGRTPVEAHHLHGVASLSVPGQMVRRGHTGLAAYACIPLCESCHRGPRGIHSYDEATWLDNRVTGGQAYALAFVIRALALQAESKAAA
jgi:hypothetical protein